MNTPDKEYVVNRSFYDDNNQFHNSGQRLSQAEYNMLPMNLKINCAENFSFDFDNEKYDLFNPKS